MEMLLKKRQALEKLRIHVPSFSRPLVEDFNSSKADECALSEIHRYVNGNRSTATRCRSKF
jgi:hypothetical protein